MEGEIGNRESLGWLEFYIGAEYEGRETARRKSEVCFIEILVFLVFMCSVSLSALFQW